jgi:hypothetical protein
VNFLLLQERVFAITLNDHIHNAKCVEYT